MSRLQTSERFALESPTPECFSALAATGKVTVTRGYNQPQANVSKMPAALTNDAANAMWTGRKTPAETAAFVARHTTDTELLEEILRAERRITVISAVFSNPLTPLEDLIELAAADPSGWTNVNAEAKQTIIARFAAMPTALALASLCDGLPEDVYVAVGGRNDITATMAAPYMFQRWACAKSNAADGSVPLIHYLCQNTVVAQQWPHDVLADMLAASGVVASKAAHALLLHNEALADNAQLCALMTDAACHVPVPATIDDRNVMLAARLAVIATLPTDAVAKLAASYIESGNDIVSMHLAGHPNADPWWWSNVEFQSPSGTIAAGRILAADQRFHDPSLWVAAHAMVDSWNGNVADFVSAVIDLFAADVPVSS